jgi:hypothetical protein
MKRCYECGHALGQPVSRSSHLAIVNVWTEPTEELAAWAKEPKPVIPREPHFCGWRCISMFMKRHGRPDIHDPPGKKDDWPVESGIIEGGGKGFEGA